ncbi:AGL176Wp [Eremothecium gossypii ATCC 10895]|uniref:AGL176Wp n=1 Tax=Eremothecium gossypii (strain ATCC 10895 / CBS 109.51 / FGSC 9923 / NRRL Y-1056) TaxID=284811 RepID=Q750W5_EREGS|nr:AGL176Wp [Eremothecium gossypii ATCC 10895]AAS54315.1 AGL176Wp [Eremothecium gossypii ATCC 10895]AEY98641.1 FAGL176Wp [Eremothecium gossypii FDAG1]
MIRGGRRPIVSSLNQPVVLHVAGPPQHLDKDSALRFLSVFIEEKETAAVLGAAGGAVVTSGGVGSEGGVDTALSSALAQLKRMERDLKGLPPTILSGADEEEREEEPEAVVGETVSRSATGGTKRRFADEEAEKAEEAATAASDDEEAPKKARK